MNPKLKKQMYIVNFLCWVETQVQGARWGSYPRHLYVGGSYIGGVLEEYPEWFIAEEYCGGDVEMIKNLQNQYEQEGSPDGFCIEEEVFYL